ncbi:MAG TPA: FxLYD domain-containing protein [Candidatus Limnocylindria bacterium]|nr:FxLYD domain-containing protein [Candidatus Limnocylindria bacterium]
MRRPFALLSVVMLAAAVARADGEGATILRHDGKWESGYGAKFYNVVGTLKNTSGHALRYVKVRIDALDDDGALLGSTDTYNESAEVLSAPGIDPRQMLASGKVKPLPAGKEERFRGGFMADEYPTVKKHRVTVVETPAAP